jgi:hypothetical protein
VGKTSPVIAHPRRYSSNISQLYSLLSLLLGITIIGLLVYQEDGITITRARGGRGIILLGLGSEENDSIFIPDPRLKKRKTAVSYQAPEEDHTRQKTTTTLWRPLPPQSRPIPIPVAFP